MVINSKTMKKLLWLTLFALPFLSFVRPQQPAATDLSTADSVNGIYIPQNLYECMNELDKILDDDDKGKIKTMDSSISMHFGLGMWIRNNWGLWQESRLFHYLKKKEYGYEPDDMSDFILGIYIEHLNGYDERWQWLDTPEGKLGAIYLIDGKQVSEHELYKYKEANSIRMKDIERRRPGQAEIAKYGKKALNGIYSINTK